MVNPIEDIKRIIYWWRRYEGIRNKKYGKIWTATDLDLLEQRIEQYCKTPSKFDFDDPDMGIDKFGYIPGKKRMEASS